MLKSIAFYLFLSLLGVSLLQGEEDIDQWSGPDFLIIGAMKCGTTSLFNYLGKHPLLLPSEEKELNFFSSSLNYQGGEGIDWYRAQFPKKSSSKEKIYEASPSYIFHKRVPERVYRHFPKTKLIALLRDPTERFCSQYKYFVKRGYEKRSVWEVINAELESFRTGESSDIVKQRTYLQRGIYLSQLKRWREFFPKEQMLIIFSEEYFAFPEETFNAVFRFLEVDEYTFSEYPHEDLDDQQGYEEEVQCLLEDFAFNEEYIRAFLKIFYKSHNEELEHYLSEDF